MFARVFDFNQAIVGVDPRLPMPLGKDEKQWLVNVLSEEVGELMDASTLVDQIDALVDSIVFAMGGLYRLGLTADQAERCFSAVMDANMAKKAGQKEGRIYGDTKDAVKPEGWVGPEQRIKGILDGE